jgi:hypothetical protein
VVFAGLFIGAFRRRPKGRRSLGPTGVKALSFCTAVDAALVHRGSDVVDFLFRRTQNQRFRVVQRSGPD